MNKRITLLILTLCFGTAYAAKTYSEDEFLNKFSGQSKQAVGSALGKPSRTDIAVKPQGAGAFMQRMPAREQSSKSVQVEMWYYTNLVRYAPKRTYRETEITFINDKVSNITFINQKRK